MIASATPNLEEIISMIDINMQEFTNQKLCDSDKVTNAFLDIRNVIVSSITTPEVN